MPQTTRTWARRELLASTNNIRAGIAHVRKVVDVYTKDHPEISASLILSIDSLDSTITLLDRVRRSF